MLMKRLLMKRLLMKFIVGAAGIWCGERSRGAPRDLFAAVASLAMALAVAALAVAARFAVVVCTCKDDYPDAGIVTRTGKRVEQLDVG